MSKYVIPRIDEPIMTPNGTMSLPWYLYLKQGGSGGGGGGGGGSVDGYIPSMLSYQWSDHKLNDMEWLRADTFSWQDGGVYFGAYQHLLEDYNAGVPSPDYLQDWSEVIDQSTTMGNHSYDTCSCCYGAGKFVAISTDGYISTSTDGITWSVATQNVDLATNSICHIAYGNGIFVAVASKTGYYSTSTDGINWETPLFARALSTSGTFSHYSSICYGNGIFVAINALGDIAIFDVTEETWRHSAATNLTPPYDSREREYDWVWRGICYNGEKFVIIATSGHVSTSIDPDEWTNPIQKSALGYLSWSQVVFDGRRILAISYQGYMSSSLDGNEWDDHQVVDSLLGTGNSWYTLCYGNNRVVGITAYSQYTTGSATRTAVLFSGKVDTIEGVRIEYFDTLDGHKICMPDQADAIARLYGKTGLAWYFILDTENERFKLPRRRSEKAKTRIVETYSSGTTWARVYADGWVEQGAYQYNLNTSITYPYEMADTNYALHCVSFVVANIGAQYVNSYTTTGFGTRSDTRNSATYSWFVSGWSKRGPCDEQETGQEHLYFFVGLFTNNALANTAGLNAELFNSKVDIGHELIDWQEPTAENNYTWYRLYKDGWVEQGGFKTAVTGDVLVTLLIPMADTHYSVAKHVTPSDNGTNTNVSFVSHLVGVQNKTTTSFYTSAWSSYSVTEFYWEARGMAAQGG